MTGIICLILPWNDWIRWNKSINILAAELQAEISQRSDICWGTACHADQLAVLGVALDSCNQLKCTDIELSGVRHCLIGCWAAADRLAGGALSL